MMILLTHTLVSSRLSPIGLPFELLRPTFKFAGIAPDMPTRWLVMLVREKLLEKRQYSQRPPYEECVEAEAWMWLCAGALADR